MFMFVIIHFLCLRESAQVGFRQIGYGPCIPEEMSNSGEVGPRVARFCTQALYALPAWRNENMWVTASTRDNVLVLKDPPEFDHDGRQPPKLTVYDPFLALPLTLASRELVLQMQMLTNTLLELYHTTNHAYLFVETPHRHGVLVVSLDNSERANVNGSPAVSRVPAICAHVKSIHSRWRQAPSTGIFAVTFIDGCRRSFDTNGHLVSWSELVLLIQQECELSWLGRDVRHHEGELSLCLATFVSENLAVPGTSLSIENHRPETGSFVSAQLTFLSPVETESCTFYEKESVFVFSLPSRSLSLTAKALRHLAWTMKSETSTVCAVGALNSIPGKNMDELIEVMDQESLRPLIDFRVPTYFSAYFDDVHLDFDI